MPHKRPQAPQNASISAPEGLLDGAFLHRSRPNDEYFCTDGLCTHEAVHLESGLVMDYEIECPKHQAAFDYRTGEALRAPACVNLGTYKTKVENGRVFIEI